MEEKENMSMSLAEYKQRKIEEENKDYKNYTEQDREERKIVERLTTKQKKIDPDEEYKQILKQVVVYQTINVRECSKVLDEKYSRIILHKLKKEYTQRETICDFADHIFVEFSGIQHNETKNVNCYLIDLWSIYKSYMKDSSFSVRRQQASFEYFKAYFSNQFIVRWYNPRVEGIQTGRKLLVQNLPDLQEQAESLNVKVVRNRKEQQKVQK